MAGTKKLYHQDAYLREFCAKVLSCTPCPDGRFAVALDETAFYPEGGGQPADHGALGPARVVDVQLQGETDSALHHCAAAHGRDGAGKYRLGAPVRPYAAAHGRAHHQRPHQKPLRL